MSAAIEPVPSRRARIDRAACRSIGIAVTLLVQAPGASARTSLAEAYGRWFQTDQSIACVDSEGRPRRCVPTTDTTMGVHVDPHAHMALVFATYLNDPTGNAVAVAAAVFREGPGGWRLVRNMRTPPERAPDKVAFGGGAATFTAATFRPGDAQCCPSGRRPYRVPWP